MNCVVPCLVRSTVMPSGRQESRCAVAAIDRVVAGAATQAVVACRRICRRRCPPRESGFAALVTVSCRHWRSDVVKPPLPLMTSPLTVPSRTSVASVFVDAVSKVGREVEPCHLGSVP
jgi:hypothetical protein